MFEMYQRQVVTYIDLIISDRLSDS